MMIRRSLVVAIGLAAVICLSGCVVHSHGRKRVHTGTHHTRVYNVGQRPVPADRDHGKAEGPPSIRHPHDEQDRHSPRGDKGKHKGHDKHKGQGKHKGHDHDYEY